MRNARGMSNGPCVSGEDVVIRTIGPWHFPSGVRRPTIGALKVMCCYPRSESEAFVGGMSCYANMVKCCSLWGD